MPKDFDFNFDQEASAGMPMDDDRLWTLLSVYIDGEATAEEAVEVEAMLRSDPAYAREFALMGQASRVAQSLPEVEPPATLRDAIFAATILRQTPAKRVASAWLRLRAAFMPPARLTLAGGACAAVALALVFASQGRRQWVAPIEIQVSPPRSVADTATPLILPSFNLLPELNLPNTPDGSSRPGGKSVSNASAHGHLKAISVAVLANKMVRKNRHGVANSSGSEHGEYRLSMVKNGAGSGRHNQRPGATERTHDDLKDVAYTPQPMMDQKVQKYRYSESDPSNRELADAETSPNSASAAGTASAAAMHTADPSAANVVLRVPHVSQLPPNTTHFISTSEIRRELEARNSNINAMLTQSIQPHEFSVAVFKGKF